MGYYLHIHVIGISIACVRALGAFSGSEYCREERRGVGMYRGSVHCVLGAWDFGSGLGSDSWRWGSWEWGWIMCRHAVEWDLGRERGILRISD